MRDKFSLPKLVVQLNNII